jgi:hypothetical protein
MVMHNCPICHRSHDVREVRAALAYGRQLTCSPECEAEDRKRMRRHAGESIHPPVTAGASAGAAGIAYAGETCSTPSASGTADRQSGAPGMLPDIGPLDAAGGTPAKEIRVPAPRPQVRKFRQIVLWPVQLIPLHEGAQIQRHWEALSPLDRASAWKEVADEFTADPRQFSERHYKEFVTFLPYVQRFLYGEGGMQEQPTSFGASSVRAFRRKDVTRVRVAFPNEAHPVVFEVVHTDLYFFHDIDVAILAVELAAENLSLATALNAMYRFGRAYPTHWEASGRGGHCAERVEWLDREGNVLAASDYAEREKYLAFVGKYRVPCVASHWRFLLEPLVLHHSGERGGLRYREIEYQRMPVMAWLAFDDASRLTRGDMVRLGLVTRPGDPDTLPYSERFLQDFEYRYCNDRYWDQARAHDWPNTRFMSNGHAFVVVGNVDEPFFTDEASGVLAQFRHQHFLLGLIAHFHKAALQMLSDRLVVALARLDIRRADSIRTFKRSVRQTLEIFLRFTHRYWFHEVSDQAQTRELFRMWSTHLGTDGLYDEVRQRILDMTQYLDSDQLRRQAETVVRLTVVTTLGLIGTVSTGFLGMNLIAAAESSLATKLLYFMLVFVPTVALTFYTVAKSKRLSEMLEALSNERLSRPDKLRALASVWVRRRADAGATGAAPRARHIA